MSHFTAAMSFRPASATASTGTSPFSSPQKRNVVLQMLQIAELTLSSTNYQLRVYIDFVHEPREFGTKRDILQKFDLCDETGTITAVAFGTVAQHFLRTVKASATYLLSNCTVKRKFRDEGSLELHLTERSRFEAHSTPIVPRLHTLADLQSLSVVNVRATITSVRQNCGYNACNTCKKKNHDDASTCDKCGATEFRWRILVAFTITDESEDQQELFIFEEVARVFFSDIEFQSSEQFQAAVEDRCTELPGSSAIFKLSKEVSISTSFLA